jgi:hypothetical protein
LILGLYQKGIFINENKISPTIKNDEILSVFVPIDGPASA